MMVDWSRLAAAAETLAELAVNAGSHSLADAHDALDEVIALAQRTQVDIALEVDRLHALIGG